MTDETVIDVIQRDHREVEQLLQAVESGSGTPDGRRSSSSPRS